MMPELRREGPTHMSQDWGKNLDVPCIHSILVGSGMEKNHTYVFNTFLRTVFYPEILVEKVDL